MPHYGTDQDVLQTAHAWLEQGHAVALVTVLKTWGSSPRPPGSLLIMRGDGVISGSVSGGCVEEDLLQRYCSQQLSDSYPTRIDYGVNREEASRLGLPCGGRLELLIEQLDQPAQLQPVLKALRQQQLIARHVDLQTGEVSLQAASAEQNFVYSKGYVRQVFGPQWHMLLIGAGHLSQYVAQFALLLGYRVIVCDPREEYAQQWQLEGTELTGRMPDEAVQHYCQQPRSLVVALTHDPKLDDMALLDALSSPAFYVGAIGSQRNCATRRQRLKQLGISPAQLQRLHAPIGLAIGSHTPPEIAVSIMAEITQLRNTASQSAKAAVSLA
ncbi:MAG: XdhC family protein [Gammaproteobacteria bacterium]|nr:XdhC family protein [Gammaproteobacteria bacterium]